MLPITCRLASGDALLIPISLETESTKSVSVSTVKLFKTLRVLFRVVPYVNSLEIVLYIKRFELFTFLTGFTNNAFCVVVLFRPAVSVPPLIITDPAAWEVGYPA